MMKKVLLALSCCLPSVLCWGGNRVETDSIHQRFRIDTVYVDAHARQRALRSAAPMHIVERKDMLTLGIADMADALHRMPGINLRDYGGAGGMKTVAVRGLGAQHTGVSYDGVLLSECQGGEIDVSRYSLDHVQTLRLNIGDNDDVFTTARQASVPALLSIETMQEVPLDTYVHLTGQVKYGSFGMVSPFLRYVQRLSKGFTLSLVGEYTYAENDYPFILHNGIYTTRERRSNSRMNAGHAELNAHWVINDRNRVWAKLYYYDNDRQLPGIAKYYNNLNAETLRERNFFAQARWLMRSTDDQWLLKVNGKANWASSQYTDSLVAKRLNDASYWQREYYASAALMWLANEHWTFDYSADYIFNNLNSTLPSDQRPRRHSLLQSLTAKYVGGKDSRWVILARLLASVYRHQVEWGDRARNFQRLSPSISMSYHLLASHTGNGLVGSDVFLRASYKDIFRVPTFNENYFFHYGSTLLDAEKTQQWNVGMTWSLRCGQRLSMQMTLDGYFNKVRDKIVGVPYNMFVWRMVNLGKVDATGVDVSYRLVHLLGVPRNGAQSVPHQLVLTASYSYQRVQNHTDKSSDNYGKQVAYIPYHTGSVAIGWDNPWLSLSLHGSGMTTRWANNNHYEDSDISGYWDMGLTAYHTFRLARHQQLELRADVKNLFNRQYEIVAHYPMPRRNWQVSVCYKM